MTETAIQPTPVLDKTSDATWAALDEQIGYKHTEPFTVEKPEDKVEDILNGVQEKAQATEPEKEIVSDGDNPENINQEEVSEEKAEASDQADESGDADALEEDKPEIDYDLEIPMSDELGTRTLGELKDAYTDMERKTVALEKERNEMVSDRNLLMNLVEAMGELPPEASAMLSQYNRQRLAREGQLMMAAIPEWADNATYLKDQQSMLGLANEYGFSEPEMRSLSDHRLVKLVRDYTMLKQKVNGAAKPKPVKKAKSKPNKTNRVSNEQRMERLISEASKSSNRDFKQAAINKLLGN